MATICLDRQVFYTPPAAAGSKPASRGLQVRNGNPSAPILGAPLRLPLPQDAHDAQHGSTGESWHDAVLIPSDDEPDDNDHDGSQSEMSFPPLDELLATTWKELESSSVVNAASNSVDATPDDSDAPEPSIRNGPSADNESSASPTSLPAEQDQRVPASLRSLECAGLSCREGLGCPKHPNLSAYYRRRRNSASPEAEADNALYPTETLTNVSSDISGTELLNGRSLTREDQCPAETGDDTGCLPLASSGIREGTLCRNEGSEVDEPKPANHEPPDVGGDCNSNLEEDCRPAHPPVSDDRGEQREHSPVPPQAQEGRASTPRVSNDESNNERRKRRRLSNTAIATGGTASQPQARCRRRRDADDDDGKDYHPDAHSDAERSEDDGVVRLPRRKRSKASDTTVSTASQRQTRTHCGDSSFSKPRTLSQRPRRQRGAAHPPSSRESTLERDTETDITPAATFEEWPLGNAVLKRVTLNGSLTTFMLEFTWSPCAEHGAGHRGTENRGTSSSAKRHRPAKPRSKGSTKEEDKPTSTSSGARYTPADDAKIRQLKEQGLSWIAMAKHFPGRSAGAIEVRYNTKLQITNPAQRGAPQLCNSPRTPSVVDNDTNEEEWEVEGICGDRRLDGGGLELLVKWKGGEETWEPYENVAETEALDEYERLHGRVTVDTV